MNPIYQLIVFIAVYCVYGATAGKTTESHISAMKLIYVLIFIYYVYCVYADLLHLLRPGAVPSPWPQ